MRLVLLSTFLISHFAFAGTGGALVRRTILDRYISAIASACKSDRAKKTPEVVIEDVSALYLRSIGDALFTPLGSGGDEHVELNYSKLVKDRFGITIRRVMGLKELNSSPEAFQKWLVAVLDRHEYLTRALRGPHPQEDLLKLDLTEARIAVYKEFADEPMLSLALKDNRAFGDAINAVVAGKDGVDTLKSYMRFINNSEMDGKASLFMLGSTEDSLRLATIKFTFEAGSIPTKRAWANYILGPESESNELLKNRFENVAALLDDVEWSRELLAKKLSSAALQTAAKGPDADSLGKVLAQFFVESPVYGLCDIFISRQ